MKDLLNFARVCRAIGCSLNGLKAVLRQETAFRQEALLFIILAPLAFWLGRDSVERALLFGSLMLVLIVELLNTAIETVVNRIGRELHELSGLAKDIASAAVLLSLILAVVIWALILTERFV